MGYRRQATGNARKSDWLTGRPRSIHRRYFFHTLLSTLLYTLVPVILLGIIISTMMIRTLNRTASDSNYNLLSQFQSGVENIINEVNYMNVQISVNSTVYSLLKKTLTTPNYNSYVTKLQPTVNSYLIPLIATRDYIDSMYIYMDNSYNRFISVPDGLCWLNQYEDTSWLDGYLDRKQADTKLWCIPRQYRKYSFLSSDTQVISIYQKFYYGQGVSIINLYASHFEQELQDLNLLPGQIIFGVNDSGEILFSNNDRNNEANAALLSSLPDTRTEDMGTYTIGGERYYVVQLFSSLGNIRYVSLTPYRSLHSSAYQFYHFLLFVIVLVTILCLIISYVVSRQFYRNISEIIGLFSAAEKGENLPVIKTPKNLYGLLMQNITRTFIQQNALKMQITENEYQNKLLELQSLQSQISPHFLFNTLKSIFWMSFELTASNNKVCQMLENMTDILDYSLTDHDSLVPLRLEIRNTKNYIEIQRVRHNYQFAVDWDYPEDLLEYRTLKLLLQPLIENCIIHAFTWEEENNRIRIRIREKDGVITIKVIDNGVGISQEKLEEIRKRLHGHSDEGHIGIYNCNRRLALTFGGDYGLTIQSRSGSGTIFTVIFPTLT